MAADRQIANEKGDPLDLRTVINSTPGLIHTSQPDGYLDFFNQTWLRYVGEPLEHLLGWKWTAFIHPDDVEGIVEKWRASLASGAPFLYEARVRRADGQYRWMLHHKVALRGQQGEILKWYGSSIDIEDRKRAEEALRLLSRDLQESKARLEEAQRITHVGYWEWDLETDRVAWADETYRIYGLRPQEHSINLAEIREMIHPEDREFVFRTAEEAIRGGLRSNAEHRVVRPSGEVRVIHSQGDVKRDASGRPYQMFGTVQDITDRKRAEEALRSSEAYLAEAQRLSHTGSFGWKPDSGEIVWTDETYRIFEYDRAEKPNLNIVLQRIHPQDRALAQQVIEGVSGSTDFEHEYRLLMPSGAIKHIRVRAHARPDSSGNIEVIGAVTDITERKTTEDKIRRLVEAGILGIFFANVDGSIVEANHAFLQMLQYDRQDLISGRLRWADLTPAEWRERDERSLAEFLETGVFHYEKEYFRKDGSRVPVLVGGARLQSPNEGVVYVLDLTEQKRSEEALRSSEAYLAEAQRMSHTGSWANSANGEPKYWSEECYRVLGFDPAEPLPSLETIFQRIHPDDRAAMREQLDRGIRDKADFEVDMRIVHPITGIRNIRSICHAVLNRCGELREMVGTVIDITERKTAEEKIRRLVDANILGVFTWNLDGAIVGANEAFLRLVQYGLEDLVSGRTRWTDLTPAEWHERDECALTELKGTGTAQPYEKEYFRKDGIRVPVLIGGALFQGGGNEGVAFVLDLSEQKQAEEALRTSEAYLAEAQRLSHTGSWAWSPDQDIRYWSEECYRVLSFDPQDGLPRFEDFLQRLHPDDQPGFRELIQTAIREKSEWEADYRIVHLDGAVRDIHVVAHPVLNTSGHLLEFVGTVIDITERKAAEEMIREQEMELRQMLDLAPQQVAVFGPNSERLYANRVALDYVGLSLEEWRQAPGGPSRPGWFIHPDDRERAARGFSKGTRPGGSAFEMELRVQGADGSYRWFLLRYNPLRDDKGQIMRWYVASTDIEDRKRAEQKLQLENAALREEIDQTSMFEEIVGTSPALQTVLSRISKVAPSDSTVLITGETGTGKELVARAIHRRSHRSGRAFVSVNCAAIPRDLIASELFGHEKGAFTGAMQRRLGRFEMADGGTIFLDEVGELSPDTQIALLRVLQEREFERVGGGHPIHVNVRVIAATNRDLQAAVSNGTFRQDLFYRFNVFPIEVPPLRERKEDILMLVEYFAQRYATRAGKNIRLIEKKTLDLLQSYDWPGNIRELQNVIERSLILSSGEVLSVDEMWLANETSQPASRVEAPVLVKGEGRIEPRSERRIIEEALVESRGRVSGPSGAAAKLGIPPSTLDHRIKALKIHKNQFKFR
jgi:PAS domain S-box-containing protein